MTERPGTITPHTKAIALVFSFAALAFLNSCANPVNAKTAQIYYRSGTQAENSGNLPLARRNFERAAINAAIGNLGPFAEASYLYEQSRVEGRLGNTAKAEAGFTRVANLLDQAGSPGSSLVAPNFTEHARLLHDTEQHSKAVPVFAKADQALRQVDAQGTDPIGYADFLHDYARSLSKSGQKRRAATIRTTAATLRAQNPGKKTTFQRKRYPRS